MRDILTDIEADILLSDPDPVRRAQIQMRANLPKRFYKEATVAAGEGGFVVQLDGRTARTPGREAVSLPNAAAAQLVADEFAAQVEKINPVTMPTLRLVNTAIDGVAKEAEGVFEDILRFASSDLLCYRADTPEGLVARENAAWDPILDWAASALQARFTLAEGIVHVPQSREAITALRIHLGRCLSDEPAVRALKLAGLHLMTSLTGSALLALAIEAQEITPEDAWSAAHVDEDWQIEQWGQDSEAVARRNARWRDMNAAALMIAALRA